MSAAGTSRTSFIVDVNKCTGCHACAMACTIANDLPVDRSWRQVNTFNELHVPGIELLHLSLACNHCEDAPCMAQCPADAYYRDELTDAVLINADICVGCQYCAWVCPYDAPKYDPDAGVMTKCTFCVDRQHQGLASTWRPTASTRPCWARTSATTRRRSICSCATWPAT